MKILFFNPQGNFDKYDSHMTEHPDFGGQLIYVKELAGNISEISENISVDIVTRRINDPGWSEFSGEIDYIPGYKKMRIIRIKSGPGKFLRKEELWPYIDEYVNNIIDFYKNDMPDFVTAHYGDGGLAACKFSYLTGIPFTFTGHSLGAQKIDKMNLNKNNFEEINNYYNFEMRINAERNSIKNAARIITSTNQERFEQYSHKLYQGCADLNDNKKFSVISPGVNTEIFNPENKCDDILKSAIEKNIRRDRPYIILSSRFDEKKNHFTAVKAYAESDFLKKNYYMVLFIRNIENPYNYEYLNTKEKNILAPIIKIILDNNLTQNIFFLDIKSQKDLAKTYNYFYELKSLFLLPSFYEPFGLAPIEAAACRLPVVATKNGGPADIFRDNSGILVDPSDTESIVSGIKKIYENYNYFSESGYRLVINNYTWKTTAEKYLKEITDIISENKNNPIIIDYKENIVKNYINKKTGEK